MIDLVGKRFLFIAISLHIIEGSDARDVHADGLRDNIALGNRAALNQRVAITYFVERALE